MVVVIGGLLGFCGSGNSNHGKDQHGLMVGFSPNICFGIIVVCGFTLGADWVFKDQKVASVGVMLWGVMVWWLL